MTEKCMIDCIATHRIRYCVEVENASELSDVIAKIENDDHELMEFSQNFLGEQVVSQFGISNDVYLTMFDTDNEYLKGWDTEKKFGFVNKVEKK